MYIDDDCIVSLFKHIFTGVPGGQPRGEHPGQAGVALHGGGGGPQGWGLLPGQGQENATD